MSMVATEAQAPLLKNGIVHRPRLLRRLEGAIPRLIVFTAPAGCGKTTLALDWLRQADLPFTWLSLDSHHNDPARFGTHLAASLARLAAALHPAEALVPPDPGAPSDGDPLQLLAALGASGGRGVIVLDDFHHIEEPAVHETVRVLLDGLGAGFHLLLLTRVDPPLPLGRMRVCGEVLELREQDLHFTRDEAGEFFRLALPTVLPDDLVDLLEIRTEGWAAGLRMAALALQDATDPEAVVGSFTGTHHFVMDYLLEEALARQPAELQRFLMQTSILSRFDADLCAAVVDDPAAARLLEAVEAANLFLVPLDGEHRWFRYHHLFAELLQHRLRRLHAEQLDVLHGRASAWLEGRGDVQEALLHASRITAAEPFLAQLDRHGMEMIARSELATFERWIRYVPDKESERYPMLLTALAWFRLLTERRPVLEPLLGAAEVALTGSAVPYAPEREELVRLLVAALRAYQLRFQGRSAESIEASDEVLRKLGGEQHMVRGALLFNVARAHMQLGAVQTASPLLRESFAANVAAGTHYLMLAGLGHTGAVLLQVEGVARAREALEAALAIARERHIENLPACGIVLYQLGRTCYLANELEHAREVLERAVELGRNGHEPEVLVNALVQLSRVRAAQGEPADAASLLTRADLIGLVHNGNLFDTTLAAERMRLALRSGDLREAEERCAALGAAIDRAASPWTPAWESEAVALLQLATRGRSFANAAALAARVRRDAEERGRGIAVCEAMIAEVLLQPPGAAQRHLLDQALREAARRGYRRVWLDWGPPVRELLRHAVGLPLSPDARAFARDLLAQEAPKADDPAPPLPKFLQRLASPLTEREQEVLHHLARGQSNKAIARQMRVSLETIKSHCKHIFAKLGANSRRDALERAHACGLLRATGAAPLGQGIPLALPHPSAGGVMNLTPADAYLDDSV